ncbi:MAG: hypothetical protein DSM106950_15725 [Stigonema ocellatum SAG 48.90 = DSM 106950]|nr:hypothetical protein [Stigonema ocellatum SAG 48.90 = DSM 106950]
MKSAIGAAKERPTLDSRLEAIRAQRHSFNTPPTPEPDQVKLLGEKSAEQEAVTTLIWRITIFYT